MLKYVVARLLQSAATLLVVALVTFLLMHVRLEQRTAAEVLRPSGHSRRMPLQ